MTKSKNTDFNAIIDLMASGNEEAIILGINSITPILNMNAIIFGAKFKCTNKIFVDALSNRFIRSPVTLMGNEISQFALAALDVIGIQKYYGNDEFIIKLIKSNFEI